MEVEQASELGKRWPSSRYLRSKLVLSSRLIHLVEELFIKLSGCAGMLPERVEVGFRFVLWVFGLIHC
jgi:hypothetical protein